MNILVIVITWKYFSRMLWWYIPPKITGNMLTFSSVDAFYARLYFAKVQHRSLAKRSVFAVFWSFLGLVGIS